MAGDAAGGDWRCRRIHDGVVALARIRGRHQGPRYTARFYGQRDQAAMTTVFRRATDRRPGWAGARRALRVVLRVCLGLGAVVLSAHLAQAAAGVPPTSSVQARTLANGLKVIVREDRRAPTVVHMVWYRAGSIDETNGRTGVAHVLEHLMFKGTATVPGGEFSRRIAAMGGRENAFTSRDHTGYFAVVPRERLDEVMVLEADRMARLVLSADDFAREIRVVMEERRWRTDDRAIARVYEQLYASAFVASPVRAPVVGWMSDLESMTVDDARDWYRRWYSPGNAFVVVAGDVDAAAVFEAAERHYGGVAAREVPPRKPQREPAQAGARRIRLVAPAENPYVVAGFRVPKLDDVDGDREPYALQMLAAVLDADENGRITRNLVRGTRIANQAGASYDMSGRGPTLFLLEGTPAKGTETPALMQALRDEVARIGREGVREDELARVRAQFVASRVYQRDSLMAQAMEIAGLESAGLSHGSGDALIERLAAVTGDEIRAVAARYFGDDRMTEVTLVPQPVGERRPPPAGMRHP